MNKKEFVDYLNTKLIYLVDSEKNKEIDKYVSVIDNYIKMGQTETDAVASFGDPNDLVTAIYLSHGLDYKKLYTGGTSFKGFKGALKRFFNIISGQDKKEAKNAILYVLYLILLVILLKIGFILVRDTLSTMIEDLLGNGIINKIYYLSFEIIYVLCAILVFVKMFTKKFKN